MLQVHSAQPWPLEFPLVMVRAGAKILFTTLRWPAFITRDVR